MRSPLILAFISLLAGGFAHANKVGDVKGLTVSRARSGLTSLPVKVRKKLLIALREHGFDPDGLVREAGPIYNFSNSDAKSDTTEPDSVIRARNYHRARGGAYQNLLEQGFLNPKEILSFEPRLAKLDSTAIRELIKQLLALGFEDIIDLVERAPYVLAYAFDQSLAVRLQRLRDRGVRDVVAVAQQAPELLRRIPPGRRAAEVYHLNQSWSGQFASDRWTRFTIDFERVHQLHQTLSRAGVNPSFLSDSLKRVLISRYDPAELTRPIGLLYQNKRDQVRAFERFGIVRPDILEREPRLNQLSTLDVLARLAWLSDHGFTDPADLVSRAPQLLLQSKERLRARFLALRRVFGLVAVEMVTRTPEVLNYDVETRIDRIVEILILDWGFSLGDVALKPFLMKFSEERVTEVRDFLIEMGFEPRKLPRQMATLIVRSLSKSKMITTLSNAGFRTAQAQKSALEVHLFGAGLFMKYFMCDRLMSVDSTEDVIGDAR